MSDHKWPLTEEEFGTPYFEDIDPDHLERILRERKDAQRNRLKQNDIANRMGNLIVRAIRELEPLDQPGIQVAVKTLDEALAVRKEAP